jgi:hypothetical protein
VCVRKKEWQPITVFLFSLLPVHTRAGGNGQYLEISETQAIVTSHAEHVSPIYILSFHVRPRALHEKKERDGMATPKEDEIRLYQCARKYEKIVKQVS